MRALPCIASLFSILLTLSNSASLWESVNADRESRRLSLLVALKLVLAMIQVVWAFTRSNLGALRICSVQIVHANSCRDFAGLVSAAFHTLFDVCALAIALLAMVYARKRPSESYTYGVRFAITRAAHTRCLKLQFDRFEVLAGFTNGIFLGFVATFLFTESFHRFWKPPELHGCALAARAALAIRFA